MTFQNFICNHLLLIAFLTLFFGTVTTAFAVCAYPKWKYKAKRAMRRGMADTVSMNPLHYIPIVMGITLVLTSLMVAGTKESDWVTEETEVISLSKEVEVLPHTDEGVDLVSVIDGENVYVFYADEFTRIGKDKPTELVIEHRDAFLRSGYDRATVQTTKDTQ